MGYLMRLVCLWFCMTIVVVSTNKLSYQEWYNKVWKKWKDVGYVTKKPFECQTKQAFGKKGVIETPNYPKHYPNNADCTWLIETPAEFTEIRIHLVQFNVENVRWSKLCIKDSLEVFQYRGLQKEKRGRYCGKHTGKEFKVYGNKVEFRFQSNQYRGRKGFRIEWEAVKGCGGVIKDASSGEMTLPKSMKTEKLFHCTWEIHAPKDQNTFTLDLEKLHLPNKGQENCRKSSVEVVDADGQVLSKYCSSLKTHKAMTIHGKMIRVRVQIARKTKRTVFRASWKTSAKKLPKMKAYSGGQCGRPYVEIAPQNMMRDIQLNEQRHRRARRLVGGTPVSRGEWPWIAQIQTTLITKHFTTKTVTCGGVIVSPTHIITAAHCVSHGDEGEAIQHDLTLGAVSSESQSSPKHLYIDAHSQIIVHPKFTIDKASGKPQNDIAIIKLKNKLEFGYDIQPLCLPSKNSKSKENKDDNCHFAGWGKTSENSLHSKRVNTIQARLWGHCDRSPSVICATYDGQKAGACKGDSGSPLVCTRKNGSKYLVGVLSYGGRTCPSMVDGHMDVRYYMDWIVNVMQNESSINS